MTRITPLRTARIVAIALSISVGILAYWLNISFRTLIIAYTAILIFYSIARMMSKTSWSPGSVLSKRRQAVTTQTDDAVIRDGLQGQSPSLSIPKPQSLEDLLGESELIDRLQEQSETDDEIDLLRRYVLFGDERLREAHPELFENDRIRRLLALMSPNSASFQCEEIEISSDARSPSRNDRTLAVDEHVRFSVYRPDRSQPGIWNTMVSFAYRAGDADEGGGGIAESAKQVEQLAAHTLGPQIQGFAALTTESREAVPREGTLRFVPRFDGVEFNPPERSFRWVEKIHRESFRYRIPASLDGQTVHGRMEVYLDVILVGEVGLALKVDSGATADDCSHPVATHGSRYRKIFASYSHKDLPIVEQFKAYADALGDDFIRDWTHLRSGEVWSEELRVLITQADVFQLFWSQNSMQSAFVREEWEYALTLKRLSFIRPMYWEEPMPEQPERGLPPETLKILHFHRFKLPSQGAAPTVVALAEHETPTTETPVDRNWLPPEGSGGDVQSYSPSYEDHIRSRADNVPNLGNSRRSRWLLLVVGIICAIIGAILSLLWRSK